MGQASGNEGILERAVIEIQDERPGEIQVLEHSQKQIAGTDTRNLTKNGSDALFGRPVGSGSSSAQKTTRFAVQFNPGELRVSAEKRESDTIMDATGTGMGAQLEQANGIARVQMKLIFDDVDNLDAFLNERLVLNQSLGGKSKGGPVKGGGGKGQREHSVKPAAEGFLAALRDPRTRKITFTWGELSYSGVLDSVNVSYTMFSPGGNPIRAEIDLSILCLASRADSGSPGDWEQRFQDAFVR